MRTLSVSQRASSNKYWFKETDSFSYGADPNVFSLLLCVNIHMHMSIGMISCFDFNLKILVIIEHKAGNVIEMNVS